MTTTVRGDLTVLREKRLSDAENDYRWRTDEELTRLDATVPIRLGFKQFLAQYRDEIEYNAPWSRRFAIDTLDQRHIGNCMYYDINYLAGTAELGILIGEREFWSRGYGTDAVNGLLRHIFTETPLRKVYLHTLDWNHRAQRSFEKSGFVPVGPVTRGGLHFIYMEIERTRWQQLQAGAEREAGEP